VDSRNSSAFPDNLSRAIARSPHRDFSMSANKTTGLILIGLGVFFLLANFNLIPDVGHLIAKWWPLILIAIGVQRWQSGAK
jgi:hypothetical protein